MVVSAWRFWIVPTAGAVGAAVNAAVAGPRVLSVLMLIGAALAALGEATFALIARRVPEFAERRRRMPPTPWRRVAVYTAAVVVVAAGTALTGASDAIGFGLISLIVLVMLWLRSATPGARSTTVTAAAASTFSWVLAFETSAITAKAMAARLAAGRRDPGPPEPVGNAESAIRQNAGSGADASEPVG